MDNIFLAWIPKLGGLNPFNTSIKLTTLEWLHVLGFLHIVLILIKKYQHISEIIKHYTDSHPIHYLIANGVQVGTVSYTKYVHIT